MNSKLDKAYQYCTRLTKKEARNFYYAFITLPSKKRKAICAIYAFSRLCDDIADEHSPLKYKVDELNNLRAQLKDSYAGKPKGQVFYALADCSSQFKIPIEYFEDIIEGVEIDLKKTRYQDFTELKSYCYKVASVVGLICINVFVYTRLEAKEYAINLGLAMQLTNIIRDIKEDAELGRIYIPLDELSYFGYSEEELIKGLETEAFYKLMSFQAKRAREYFAKGYLLMPLLPIRSRACPAILAGIYSALLDKIEREKFKVFHTRISLNLTKKLLIMIGLWIQSLCQLPKISEKL